MGEKIILANSDELVKNIEIIEAKLRLVHDDFKERINDTNLERNIKVEELDKLKKIKSSLDDDIKYIETGKQDINKVMKDFVDLVKLDVALNDYKDKQNKINKEMNKKKKEILVAQKLVDYLCDNLQNIKGGRGRICVMSTNFIKEIVICRQCDELINNDNIKLHCSYCELEICEGCVESNGVCYDCLHEGFLQY